RGWADTRPGSTIGQCGERGASSSPRCRVMSDEPDETPEADEPDGPSQRQTVIALAVVVEGGMILLAWLLGWLFNQPPLKRVAWDGGDAVVGVLAPLPPLLLVLLVLRWPVGPLRRIKRFSEEVVRPLLAPCTLVDLLGISVLAGLGEEMLFRGVFQGAFERWLP